MKKLGIYLHIPFCVKKCTYCDFNSSDKYTSKQEMEYTMALLKEMVLYSKAMKEEYIVDSIYIGGGTPSCLPENAICALVSGLYSNFMVSEDCEITIEANPKTLTYTKVGAYKKAGINRLSLGVQSFHRDELDALGRIHTPQEFYANYEMAREAGFDNISFDLMFGIPHQTPEKWAASIGVALKLKPEHISFYSLELEKKTPLFWSVGKGDVELPDEVDDRIMYHYAIAAFKKAGYNHYEISNCALPGKESRHNLKYWSMMPYLGLGLGASSFLGGKRAKNIGDMRKYMDAVNNNILPLAEVTKNTQQDSISEFIFTGLRKTEGICLSEFKELFGEDFYFVYQDKIEVIRGFISDGLLSLHGGRLALTEKGLDISNRIMAEFMQ